MVVSSRDFSATLEIGVTVPIEIDIDRHRLALRLGQFNRDHARPLRALRAGAAAHP